MFSWAASAICTTLKAKHKGSCSVNLSGDWSDLGNIVRVKRLGALASHSLVRSAWGVI